jgi:hypothetical protein
LGDARGRIGDLKSRERNSPRPFVLARGMSSSESEDILKGNGGTRGGRVEGVKRGWELNRSQYVDVSTRIRSPGRLEHASERVENTN